jgi:hypothetical protein
VAADPLLELHAQGPGLSASPLRAWPFADQSAMTANRSPRTRVTRCSIVRVPTKRCVRRVGRLPRPAARGDGRSPVVAGRR